MRVLIVGKYYFPVIGGMEKTVRDLAEGLSQLGHEVVVVCSNTKKNYQREELNGVVIHRLPTLGLFFNLPLSIWTKKYILDFNPNIVNVHLPNPLALILFKLKNVKTVYTFHTLTLSNKIISKLHEIFLKLILKKKMIAVVTSEHLKKTIIEKNICLNPILINLGIKALPEYKGLIHKKYDLIFVGRLVKYKGLDILIKAISKTKKKLLIVGDGPEKIKLIKLSESLFLTNLICFSGEQTDQILSESISNSRVMVLPSISPAEAFGLCLLEGMSKGLALITTSIDSGVREVNIEKETGLWAIAGDVESLANVIKLLLSDLIKIEDYGQRAKNRFQNKYKYELMVGKYENLFKTINSSYSLT